MEFFELRFLERQIVHLADKVDKLLEPVPALLIVLEIELTGAYVKDQVHHVSLSLPRAERIDRK